MNQESIKAYTNRISQANRTELTVIIFDIIIEEIDSSLHFWETGKKEEMAAALKKAQLFLLELMGSLDYRYHISQELRQLYLFMNREILLGIRTKEKKNLPEVREMLQTLRESFEMVSGQDNSPALMENTQKIYAGLTYGRGTLNEVYLDANQTSRGFTV